MLTCAQVVMMTIMGLSGQQEQETVGFPPQWRCEEKKNVSDTSFVKVKTGEGGKRGEGDGWDTEDKQSTVFGWRRLIRQIQSKRKVLWPHSTSTQNQPFFFLFLSFTHFTFFVNLP